MNELPTEVKAQEIHEKASFWHNRAEFNLYKFLLEIKKLRDERLYKELGYSTFEEYCSEEWSLSRETVYKKIQAAEKMKEQDFVYYSTHFGDRKTYFLATMTDEQKEQSLNEGVPTEQGYKDYKKATQKEIAEYKRNSEEMERKAKEYEEQLKQRDEQNAQLQSQVEQAQRSEEIARKQLEDAEDKEPEIKREVKEVIPPHVKAQLSDRKRMIDAKDKEIEQLQEQISKAEEQKQRFEKQDYLEDEEQIASMNFQVESTVLEIKDNINRFLNENSANAFKEAAIARASERTKNQIYDGIEELEAFCRTMRRSLDSNVIIGG